MFLTEGNQFLFTLLDVLVIEVKAQSLTLLLEFDLVTEKHHLLIQLISIDSLYAIRRINEFFEV